MQRAVAEGWDDLQRPLLAAMPGAGTITWRSPLQDDDFAEYRDKAFLDLLGLGSLADELAAFWPARGPQWDGLGTVDNGAVLLCEAKAHIGEFCSSASQASDLSLAKIKASLLRAALALGVDPENAASWHRLFYQYTNRLAHLFWLREHGVSAKLVLIGFVHDDDMPGKTTPEAWPAALSRRQFRPGTCRTSSARDAHHPCPSRCSRTMTAQSTIWTIGYEQATQPQVIAALQQAGVELVADVRALPLSRRPGFSKSALAGGLGEAGIGYWHVKPLGTPADGRAAARAGDYTALERIYAGQLELPEAMAAGAELAAVAGERRVALLCYERDAAHCHRTLIRRAMLPGFDQVDLTP